MWCWVFSGGCSGFVGFVGGGGVGFYGFCWQKGGGGGFFFVVMVVGFFANCVSLRGRERWVVCRKREIEREMNE